MSLMEGNDYPRIILEEIGERKGMTIHGQFLKRLAKGRG